MGGFFLQTVKDSWPYLERGSLQREWDGRCGVNYYVLVW